MVIVLLLNNKFDNENDKISTFEMGGSAVDGNLTVNGGAVYLEGSNGWHGDPEPAVDGSITLGSGVTLYGWNGSTWGTTTSDMQYVSTDNSTVPSTWTW